MTNRPAGGARSKRWERADFDFYREPPWVVEQLFDAISFGPKGSPDLIYDPCCGKGNVLDVAKARGHRVYGSDIVERGTIHPFVKNDILRNALCPPSTGRRFSIVCNPPYSYEDRIAERVFEKVLTFIPAFRTAFLVPIAFLCSEGRFEFFSKVFNPSHILICSQRPTMPPGALIDQMVSPFEGGMQDYCWIVYTGPRHRWKTETRWLRPTTK